MANKLPINHKLKSDLNMNMMNMSLLIILHVEVLDINYGGKRNIVYIHLLPIKLRKHYENSVTHESNCNPQIHVYYFVLLANKNIYKQLHRVPDLCAQMSGVHVNIMFII